MLVSLAPYVRLGGEGNTMAVEPIGEILIRMRGQGGVAGNRLTPPRQSAETPRTCPRNANPWPEYEAGKALIAARAESPAEYEREIAALARRLGL